MVNAQEWLEQNYPNRSEIEKVSNLLKPAGIEGKLVISDFPNLKQVDFNSPYDFSCQIKNCPKLEKMSINSSEIKNLSFLDCSQLGTLIMKNCAITSLDLSNCSNLTYLDVVGSKLLNDLDISNNFKLDCIFTTGTGKDFDYNTVIIKKLVEKIQSQERQLGQEKLTNLEKKITELQTELAREKSRNKFLTEQLEVKIEVNHLNQ